MATAAKFRIDVAIHDLLMNSNQRPPAPAESMGLTLPEPVFPRFPDRLKDPGPETPPEKRKWGPKDVYRYSRGWLVPYVRSRVLPGDFHPITAYLFVEYKCNQGFWVYIATNGRLLRPEVADRLGDAGVSVFNFAMDSWDLKPSLPKALVPAQKNLEHILRKQYVDGYLVFFNMNICRNNTEDIRKLTEYAHDHRVATDYHINETPMLEQDDHFKHLSGNGHQAELLASMPGVVQEANGELRFADWNCRAGQNNVIIRTDGTVAPCFPMYASTYDWGNIDRPKFDQSQLTQMKSTCQRHCFSTLNHNLAYCYNDARVIKWLWSNAIKNKFQGGVRSFED